MEEKMRKFLYCAAAFAVIGGSFFGFLKAADYAGVNDARTARRYTFHDYYEQDNIDVLFVGSSQTFYSIDCGIMDEKLGKNTFDLGTASQRLTLSSFLVEDAAHRYDLEHVYVYLGYRQARNTKDKISLENLSYVTDGLRSIPDKCMLIGKYSSPDQYMNALLPVRRNLENLFDPATLAGTLSIKSTDEYKNYMGSMLLPAPEIYGGKGHVAGAKSIEEGTLVSTYTPDPVNLARVTDVWKNSLQDIIDFCKAEDIGLTFFAPPLSSCVLLALEDQDSFIQEIYKLIEGSGYEFVDFSLLKKEYWPDTSTLYNDDTHLNQFGAERFTEIFADYINGDVSKDEIFYGSIRERFEDLEPAFYGASIKDCTLPEGPGTEYHLIGNPAGQFAYKVDLVTEDGQIIPLQDYDKNDRININKGTTGVLKVSALLEGETEPLSETELKIVS